MYLLRLTILATALVASLASAAEPPTESPITAADREHWSYQPLRRPTLPTVADEQHWARTPVDLFILKKLAARSLAPSSEAARGTLLRRLAFDLTGLPPTPDERHAFLADTSPNAYERLVDRLLASPAYGERWGQHWLDLARFAETDGFEHDKTRPQAWKYRDWVVHALNRDLPYDQFLSLQLAGDELHPGEEQARIATMFCLSGPDMPDINDQALRRHNLLNELTGTIGSTFLAMQLGCAQCHDHKYDPISQADFFRLRAIFDPAVQIKREQPIGSLSEPSNTAAPSFFYTRGELTRPSAELSPAFPRIVNHASSNIPAPTKSAKTTGRRAALANWLSQPDHPLTARVMANRVWQHHFGKGLSNTPSDFGLVGEAPSHPELLDYLTVELVDHQWSLKHLHRLIVLSSVYRQASGVDSSGAYAAFPRRRLEAEAIRDAMLAISGQLNLAAGGPGVMPPLAPEIQKTLLGDHWKTSPDPSDHTRRSIYIFARRNLRYPLLEAFDRADANQTCPARHESTTAIQALSMFNSTFSRDMAKHLTASVLRQSQGDLDAALPILFVRVLGREPNERERQLLHDFLTTQAKTLDPAQSKVDLLATPELANAAGKLTPQQTTALVDLALALFNTSEFIYVD